MADRFALLVVVLTLGSFLFVAGNVNVGFAGLLLLLLVVLLLGLQRLDLGSLDRIIGLLGHLGELWVFDGVTLLAEVGVELGNHLEEILVLGQGEGDALVVVVVVLVD